MAALRSSISAHNTMTKTMPTRARTRSSDSPPTACVPRPEGSVAVPPPAQFTRFASRPARACWEPKLALTMYWVVVSAAASPAVATAAVSSQARNAFATPDRACASPVPSCVQAVRITCPKTSSAATDMAMTSMIPYGLAIPDESRFTSEMLVNASPNALNSTLAAASNARQIASHPWLAAVLPACSDDLRAAGPWLPHVA